MLVCKLYALTWPCFSCHCHHNYLCNHVITDISCLRIFSFLHSQLRRSPPPGSCFFRFRKRMVILGVMRTIMRMIFPYQIVPPAFVASLVKVAWTHCLQYFVSCLQASTFTRVTSFKFQNIIDFCQKKIIFCLDPRLLEPYKRVQTVTLYIKVYILQKKLLERN